MKNYIRRIPALIMLSLVAVAIVSCKDDDDDDVVPGVSIVGEWKGDQSEIEARYAGITVYDETDEIFDVLLEFKEDGTVSFTRNGTETTGTYELKGNKLTTTVDFQMEGVDLTNVTFTVVELTETELELYLDREQVINVPDFGNVTARIIAELEFDRLR